MWEKPLTASPVQECDTMPAAGSAEAGDPKEKGLGNELIMKGVEILRKYLMWVMLLLRGNIINI
jgi:hypothetical protein